MNTLSKCLTIFSLSMLISACVETDINDSVSDAGSDISNRKTISGNVSDGPVVGGTVTLKNADGVVLATTTTNQQAKYSISAEIHSDDYPLLLEASNGINLVTGTTPDFMLLSIIPNDSYHHANLNPHSTIIVKTAKSMHGGLTDSNLEQAREIVITQLNFGLDTELINDPIATEFDSVNLQEITYASEALAEMIRRTSSALSDNKSEEVILNALSADLADGKLDGKGSTGTYPRHTAVSKVVSLQVLLETMLQDLKVNGVSAEQALADAIYTVLEVENKASRSYRRKYINWAMLKQARTALAAIQQIDPSVTFVDLMRVFKQLGQETTTDELVAALTQHNIDHSISDSLEDSIDQTVDASEESIDLINAATDSSDNDNDVDIINPDDENTLSISGTPTISLAEGDSYTFTPQAADSDENDLIFSIKNLPSWANFNTTTGTLSGTPGFNDAGHYENILITVSDGSASASLDPFSIQVSNTNLPPSISGHPATSVTEGKTYFFKPQAADSDEDELTFSIRNLPVWANFSTTTGALSGTPGFDDAGRYADIRITVSDGGTSASLDAFSIQVSNTNQPPSISGHPATSVTEGKSYYFKPQAADSDGDDLIFSIRNLPVWANFSTTTGTLAGTPGFDDAGRYADIRITVSDGSNSASLDAFSIQVTNTNQPPSISGHPATSVTEGKTYFFKPQAADSDGDDLIFSIRNLPVWANFSTTTGTLSGTPGFDDAGHYENILFTVSDGSNSASLDAFSIQVSNTNQPPSISGHPATSVTEGKTYFFKPQATDSDEDDLTFSIRNLPGWANFSTTTGTLSGTLGFDDAGRYDDIRITVSDGSNSASLDSFSIQVSNTNLPPSISGHPVTSVTEGKTYFFKPQATDSDEDDLTFSIRNLPVWANFSTTTGTLSGTPGFDDAGRYADIRITVSDGSNSASLDSFSIQVSNTNLPPSISGHPATSVTEGEVYIFIPQASDPDDDELTFSATNLPSWIRLDITTGMLSGNPDSSDVGLYEDINIMVSDGAATVSLDAFNILVTTSPTRTANLTWEIPTTRTDGSPLALSEIDGFRIYMGKKSNELNMILDLNDGNITSYKITDLTSGTYYFSVTTYDTDGNESEFSNIPVKTIM